MGLFKVLVLILVIASSGGVGSQNLRDLFLDYNDEFYEDNSRLEERKLKNIRGRIECNETKTDYEKYQNYYIIERLSNYVKNCQPKDPTNDQAREKCRTTQKFVTYFTKDSSGDPRANWIEKSTIIPGGCSRQLLKTGQIFFTPPVNEVRGVVPTPCNSN